VHLHHSLSVCFESTCHFKLRDACQVTWYRWLCTTYVRIRCCRVMLIHHPLRVRWHWRDVKRLDVFLEWTSHTTAILISYILLPWSQLIVEVSLIYWSNAHVWVVLQLQRRLLVVLPLSVRYDACRRRQIFVLGDVILRHAACWGFQLTYNWRVFFQAVVFRHIWL